MFVLLFGGVAGCTCRCVCVVAIADMDICCILVADVCGDGGMVDGVGDVGVDCAVSHGVGDNMVLVLYTCVLSANNTYIVV